MHSNQSHSLAPTSYYPFGMVMPGREHTAGEYKFGFNGKEKDVDISGDNYDFGARIYDGRIGRWLSNDPLGRKYAEWNPFHFSFNKPIVYNDKDGKDGRLSIVNHSKEEIIKTGISKTITLQSNIFLYGPDASKVDITELNKKASDLNNTRYFFNETSKETYRVDIIVSYSYCPALDNAANSEKSELKTATSIIAAAGTTKEAIGFKEGDNVMQVDLKKLTATGGYQSGVDNGAGLQGYAAQGGSNGVANIDWESVVHETSHELGFDERYASPTDIIEPEGNVKSTGTHPGFDGDVMQGYSRSTGGDAPKITFEYNAIHHFDILNYAFENRNKFKNGALVLSGQKFDNTNGGANTTSKEIIQKVENSETDKPK